MIVRQYAPCSLGRSIICLGKQGEINALRVEFDVSAWMAMYPDATVKLMHFAPDRPQDNPVIPTLGVEGTLRVWIVGEEDTAGAGNGVIELLLIDERTGSTIKSATGYTTVLRSPSAGIEAQEAEAGYVRYDVDQSTMLTDEQKAVARKNIGAGTGDSTGSGGIMKETDPTVPDWAKQPSKPTYTAGEVHARPDTWTPSASDVGADAAGTASGAVAAHNTSGAAHADLRALIEGLTSRLNALADSDDTTLDQLSEIVAYIKSNRTLIDAVTTGKVSVSDIVDNLTTNASGKVLSAAQGVALKAMIDGIVIPTALPNPQPITINGQRYDGSEAVEVNVAAEGGGATVELDTTLTQSGKAADAKVVGDKLTELNQAIDAKGDPTDDQVREAVNAFLAANPGAVGASVYIGPTQPTDGTRYWLDTSEKEEEQGPATYSVTLNLTNVTSDNNATTATEGSTYSGALTADDGYVIQSVSVTMGGVDVTGTSYDGGNIYISSVTGDIVITAEAVEQTSGVTTYTITNNLINCTSSNSSSAVDENAAYSATITANDGYTLTGASVSVTMGGSDVTADVYADGIITIVAVTGDVVISVDAVDIIDTGESEVEVTSIGSLNGTTPIYSDHGDTEIGTTTTTMSAVRSPMFDVDTDVTYNYSVTSTLYASRYRCIVQGEPVSRDDISALYNSAVIPKDTTYYEPGNVYTETYRVPSGHALVLYGVNFKNGNPSVTMYAKAVT